MQLNTNIQDFVLKTLSFFEPMTFSQIILDFDNDLIKDFPDLDKEQLQKVIDLLEKKKFIKKVIIDKEIGWIRIHRKRSWLTRLLKGLTGMSSLNSLLSIVF